MSREPTQESDTQRTRGIQHLPFLLRIGAFVLVPTGFIGFLTTDTTPFDTDSLFTLLFGLGIACAVLSIYLGLFLNSRGD